MLPQPISRKVKEIGPFVCYFQKITLILLDRYVRNFQQKKHVLILLLDHIYLSALEKGNDQINTWIRRVFRGNVFTIAC